MENKELTIEEKKEIILHTYVDELCDVLKKDGWVNLPAFEKDYLKDNDDENRYLKSEAMGKIVNTFKSLMKEEMTTLLIDNLD